MSCGTIWRPIALAAALVAAVTWLIAGHQAAQAGHTFGGGHCLSPLESQTCRYIYSLQGENLLGPQKSFHLWNFRFASNWNSAYETALDQAEFNWGKSVGPQAPTEAATSNTGLSATSDYYYNCSQSPLPPREVSEAVCRAVKALTCRIDVEFISHCTVVPVNTEFSQIFIYHDFFVNNPALRLPIMAHEMGHSLGLDHHNSSSCLMQPGTTLTGPQSCDLGSANPFSSPKVGPCDGDPHDYGIRCIYWWWREQGKNWDCFDPTRDGRVRVADIVAAVNAYGSEAGDVEYHPDADVDRNGLARVADINNIQSQYGDDCDIDHYPQS